MALSRLTAGLTITYASALLQGQLMIPPQDAVPPLVPEEQLLDALQHYDLPGSPKLRFIARGFNDHYQVDLEHAGRDRSAMRYILRVYLPDKPYIRGVQDFEDELLALTTFARHGVPVSAPIPRRDGTVLGRLSAGGHVRPVALFSHADGEELEGTAISERAARNLGQVIAQMHEVADAHQLGLRRYTLDETFLVERPLALLQELLGPDAGDLAAFGEQLRAGVPTT
jgi:Ser/Thr protein kinase RdoA (MazF antagonist)